MNSFCEKNKPNIIGILSYPPPAIMQITAPFQTKDFDELMEYSLQLYNEIKNDVKRDVEDIFFAADVQCIL